MTAARISQHTAEVLTGQDPENLNARVSQHTAEVLTGSDPETLNARVSQHTAEVLAGTDPATLNARTSQFVVEVLRSVAETDRATIEAFEETSVASTTSLTLTVPGAAGVGDFLLAYITWSGSPTVTPPAGWELVDISGKGAVYSRVVDGTEPANYTWNFDASTDAYGIMMSVTNVDLTDPIADFTVQDDSTSPLELISLTATRNNSKKITGGQGTNTGTGVGRPDGNDLVTKGNANSISYVVAQQTVDTGAIGTTIFPNDIGVASRHGFAIILNSAGEPGVQPFFQKIISSNAFNNGSAVVGVGFNGSINNRVLRPELNHLSGLPAQSGILKTRFDDRNNYFT